MKYLVLLVLCLHSVLAERLYFKDTGSRIINGTRATQGQFPWQVALFIGNDSGWWFCGGGIISVDWILTAGHCVDKATNATIWAGSVELEDPAAQVALGIEFYGRDDFNRTTAHNDIGLIKLQQPLTLNENVQVVRLADQSLEEGVEVTVSGWGYVVDEAIFLSDILRYVQLETLTNAQCQEAFPDDIIYDEMVCATSDPDQHPGPCSGDSGGPVVTDPENDPEVVAVVSFSSGNGCESGDPSGYARVAYFRDWIKEVTGI